jgi:hypothetical protein
VRLPGRLADQRKASHALFAIATIDRSIGMVLASAAVAAVAEVVVKILDLHGNIDHGKPAQKGGFSTSGGRAEEVPINMRPEVPESRVQQNQRRGGSPVSTARLQTAGWPMVLRGVVFVAPGDSGVASNGRSSRSLRTAQQKIGFHGAFTLDVDVAMRLAPKTLA